MADTQTEEVEFDADIFDSMLHGTFEEAAPEEETTSDDEVEEDEGVDEAEADDAEDFEDDEQQEDTDQDEESEDDEELDEDTDGDPDEGSETEEEDEEEDALVEDYDSDDEGDDTNEEEEEADEAEDSEEEDVDEESEDDTDTEDQSDGDDQDTSKVDYKAFYDAVVNTEFVVNGKKTKGFADPQKIIQSQQMAGGFSEKMAGFKQYRPFMAPLKDRGMLDDQTKFDLAMNLIDGDKEAIKKHLQTLNIDPLDLDMEQIEYAGKSNVASQESLVIEDTMERAKSMGVEDRVRQVIGKEWDAESFQEFVSNDAVRNDLLNHMESGAYETVQDKMSELSRLDYNGAYGGMTTINKYRAAVTELQREQANTPAPQQPAQEAPKKAPRKTTTVKSEKAKIAKSREETEYKAKAAEQEVKRTAQRKKAASMSKKKVKAKPKAKFDPLALEGKDFEDHFDFLLSGGR